MRVFPKILFLIFSIIILHSFVRITHFYQILGAKDDITSQNIHQLINILRQDSGLEILTYDISLEVAAQNKADHMVQNSYFSHTINDNNPTWQFILDEDYLYSMAGENLAKNFSDSTNLTDSWIRSPSHQANILSKNYTHTGIGIAYDTSTPPQTIVVQVFALPLSQEIQQQFLTTSTPVLHNRLPLHNLFIVISLILVALVSLSFTLKKPRKKKRGINPKHWHT